MRQECRAGRDSRQGCPNTHTTCLVRQLRGQSFDRRAYESQPVNGIAGSLRESESFTHAVARLPCNCGASRCSAEPVHPAARALVDGRDGSRLGVLGRATRLRVRRRWNARGRHSRGCPDSPRDRDGTVCDDARRALPRRSRPYRDQRCALCRRGANRDGHRHRLADRARVRARGGRRGCRLARPAYPDGAASSVRTNSQGARRCECRIEHRRGTRDVRRPAPCRCHRGGDRVRRREPGGRRDLRRCGRSGNGSPLRVRRGRTRRWPGRTRRFRIADAPRVLAPLPGGDPRRGRLRRPDLRPWPARHARSGLVDRAPRYGRQRESGC